MPNQPLILLFGHENSLQGQLSEVAVSRCNVAIYLLAQNPNAIVLPTGAFGAHFNKTDRAHSGYLRDYLSIHGVKEGRMLLGTDSSNTLEDCLCARKLVLDNTYSSVIAVTSEYHSPRVRYILDRVFRGIQFSVREAETPSELIDNEKQKEKVSFDWLKKNWVTPPLYKKNAPFPETVYEAAAHDQRHYDTVSLAAVTGALVLSGIVFQSVTTANVPLPKAAILWAGALIDFCLFVIYERCAATARTARRSMRLTEIGFDVRGFSASYDPVQLFMWLPSIQTTVRYLFAIVLTMLVTFGILSTVGCYAMIPN